MAATNKHNNINGPHNVAPRSRSRNVRHLGHNPPGRRAACWCPGYFLERDLIGIGSVGDHRPYADQTVIWETEDFRLGLLPTWIDGRAVAGLQARPISRIAEGKDFLEAYHKLHSQILG